MANTEEFQDGKSNGALGEVFIRCVIVLSEWSWTRSLLVIRCNNVLYIISTAQHIPKPLSDCAAYTGRHHKKKEKSSALVRMSGLRNRISCQARSFPKNKNTTAALITVNITVHRCIVLRYYSYHPEPSLRVYHWQLRGPLASLLVHSHGVLSDYESKKKSYVCPYST